MTDTEIVNLLEETHSCEPIRSVYYNGDKCWRIMGVSFPTLRAAIEYGKEKGFL
jgi:hypothetical protein